MANIYHYFPIKASISDVFHGISTPSGLNVWWCRLSKGNPDIGETYILNFGENYIWEAFVSKFTKNKEFELTITSAESDWKGTKVGFDLNFKVNTTHVRFYHTGWRESNEHFRTSCYCWAMYLRILKRFIEFGELVPYEDRLEV